MSGITIKSGDSGNIAKVDDLKRLHTHSFSVTIDQSAALAGDSYNVSSGVVTLTDATESAVFYLKNTSSDDFLMNIQIFFAGPTTGGASLTAGFEIRTGSGIAGTIVDNAVPGITTNARINDSTVLGADLFKGAQGATVTGGDVATFVSDGFVSTAAQVLPPGNAISIAVTPSTGNTSQIFQYTISLIANAGIYAND